MVSATEDVEMLIASYPASRNVKWCSHCGKVTSPQNRNTRLSLCPGNSNIREYKMLLKVGSPTDPLPFTAASVMVARSGKASGAVQRSVFLKM